MAIKVIKAGMLTTVQDFGRFGFQKSGMVVGGAMDALALQLGNMMLGNAENEAGLECTMMGPTIYFEKGQLIAITGGDLSPCVDNQPISMWKPVYVPQGATLSFGHAKSGCRSYICFWGGLDVPVILKSKSTYLHGKIGGWHGRTLEKDDKISFRHHVDKFQKTTSWHIRPTVYPDLSSRTIRVTKGPHLELFEGTSIVNFFSNYFSIKNESDRMGYRLDGEALQLKKSTNILSSAVTFGTIQVPSQDQVIILMADRPTSGGYPIIGQVATIDLSLLAQIKPQEPIHFEFLTLDEAQQLLADRQLQLNRLKRSIALKYEQST